MPLLQTEEWPAVVAERSSTEDFHMIAVERVIQTMYASLSEPLSLEDLADVACLSPYYFLRVFHQRIGIPPGEFLASLRLNAAKRLLLTTDLSVTDICFSVGYTGLGTFTTRFTQLIGLSPRLLRQHALNEPVILSVVPDHAPSSPHLPSPYSLRGSIQSPYPFHGNIFIGLFSRPIPQGHPVSCTRLSSPGPFSLDFLPGGKYYLLVAAIPSSSDPITYLLPAPNLLVASAGPFTIAPSVIQHPLTLSLRRPGLTDPPILSALPYL